MEESAEMWCWMSRLEADQFLTNNNLSWPFSNVSIDAFYELAKPKTKLIYQIEDALWYVAMVVLSAGVLFNALLVCTFWKKVFKEKNAFYASMFIIAVFDLIFVILNIINQTWYNTFMLQGSKSFIAIWSLLLLNGVLFTVRVAADLVALALTVERYISVGKPQFYKNLTSRVKRNVRLAVLFFVILLSATKMYYTFARDVALAGDTYHIITSNSSAFWTALATFSDMVMPFVLLVVTPIVSAGFRAAAHKHYGKSTTKVQQIAVAQTVTHRGTAGTIEDGAMNSRVMPKIENKNKDWQSMLTLTLILDVMLMLTQIVSCFICVADWVCTAYEVSYNAGYNHLWWWWLGTSAVAYLDIPMIPIETLTHSFNFVFYMLFSHTMRIEFGDFMKRMRQMKFCHFLN